MSQISQSTEPYNRLLKRLARDDFALLAPHLESVDLPLRQKLEVRNRRIEHVYFPRGGFASVVINGNNGNSIEVALIGREGMTGLAVLMGTDRAPYDIFIQFAGEGYRMTVDSLRRVIARNPQTAQCLAALRPCLHRSVGLYLAGECPIQNGRAPRPLAADGP